MVAAMPEASTIVLLGAIAKQSTLTLRSSRLPVSVLLALGMTAEGVATFELLGVSALHLLIIAHADRQIQPVALDEVGKRRLLWCLLLSSLS